MHEAYQATQLLKLPLNIESICSAGDNLFVGTKEGHLLMYGVVVRPGLEPEVQLLRSNKYFSKKPILKLAVVPEYSILVALKEGVVSVHDIDMAVTNFPLISSVPRSKGCTLFSLSVLRTSSLTGEVAVAVRMCVVLRRKMQFYYWKNRKFWELQGDLSLGDIPKSVAWGGESLCFGTRGEYSLYSVGRGEQEGVQDLFPTGRNQEPKVTLLQDNRFALDKDDQTTFISPSGQLNPKAVQWSEVPQAMVHDQPYLVSVLSKSVEIRTDEPRILIQTLELPKPRLVSCSGQGRVYIASTGLVWCLTMVPVSEQVPQLLRDKQFELAVTVANICDESLTDKSRRIQHIQTLMAFDLFCNHKFKESMEVFFQLDICPSHVIGLYTGLLPAEFQDKLVYPDSPPVLQGREMENGLLALIAYLTQMRHKLNNASAPSTLSPQPLVDGIIVIKSKRQALQIIDTTLLKCYLQTNDALVAPLLRLKDNNCHLEEAERFLKKSQKFTELVIFYNTRKLHRKALELLSQHSSKPDSPLSGHSRTVTYLQNLYAEHIDLILEFSLWVILACPEDGLTIFTEDMDTVESLPRGRVLEWLLRNARQLVIPYLEHLILVWGETNQLFHNSLILQYKDVILDSGHTDTDTQRKLRKLLHQDPTYYTAEQVLPKFPYDCLFEERAVLLGRGGRHREALIVYIHILGDLEKAMEYCRREKASGKPVYQHLVELLVVPPDQSQLPGVRLPEKTREPDLDAAVAVLEQHGQDIDLGPVLTSLPGSASLHRLANFLTAAIQAQVAARHSVQLVRALQHSAHIQLQETRVMQEGVRLDMNERSVCVQCGKRFTTLSAFARRPDGKLLHYSCAMDTS
eukprot:GFUD01101091.1.p1 GENE.GFUD01101091.1~~GFUD01101091.1.p1  ORF type:complete len:856 (+),score=262.22 GFUD01101091.1:72-2639(+)